MASKSRIKVLSIILMFLLFCSGSYLNRTFAMLDDPTASCALVDGGEEEKNTSDVKEKAIVDLAGRLCLPVDDVGKILHINGDLRLVPLVALDEHKNCLIDIFSKSDKEYMKYYRDGQLMSPEQVEERYYRRVLHNFWEKPEVSSITFIIDYNNKSVGRIGVGPIKNMRGQDCEIGYAIKQECCGKNLTTTSVKAVLNLLQYMIENKPEEYNFNRLRATAREDNIASNRILEKLNFRRSPEPVECVFGERLEYFYYFAATK